jgi:hypothetical protein
VIFMTDLGDGVGNQHPETWNDLTDEQSFGLRGHTRPFC